MPCHAHHCILRDGRTGQESGGCTARGLVSPHASAVCISGRLSGRAYHKQISRGSSTTLRVLKLVLVVPKLLPVDHPIRGVQIWAGLVLDHEGVAQKGDDIDRSSQQHSVGGIPIINLQRVSRAGQAALQSMLCGLAMYSQTSQESLSGRDSAGRWPSLCRCTANLAQHYSDGYTSLHGMEGSKMATALWKTASSRLLQDISARRLLRPVS